MAKVEELIVEIGAKIDKLEAGLKKGEKKVDGFSDNVKALGGIIAGAFSVSKVAAFTKEVVILAGEAQGVENAFKRFADAKILDGLRKATRGTVSDLQLMKNAVQAKNLGLPIKDLASLFEFASRRAQETGESVEFLTNSIVLGIGRKSPLILDNLGISAVRLREELKGVGTETASVADVASAVGRIAKEAMENAGDAIVTTKDKTEQLKATWENLKLEIGKTLTEESKLTSGLLDTSNEILQNQAKGLSLSNQINRVIKEQGAELGFGEKVLTKWLARWGVINDTAQKLLDTQKKVNEEAEKTSTNENIEQAIPLLKGMKDRLTELKVAREGAFSSERVRELTFQISILEKKIKDLTSITITDVNLPTLEETPIEELIGGLSDIEIDEQAASELDFVASKLRDIKDEQDEVNKGFAEFNQKVSQSAQVAANAFLSTEEGIKNLGKSVLNNVREVIKAYLAEAIAGSVAKALASVPPPLNLALAAVAGTTASALFNSIVPKANSGLIVPGNSSAGDRVQIAANSGEMILSKPQQRNLFSMLNGSGSGGRDVRVVGQLKASGRELRAVLETSDSYDRNIFDNNR